MYELPTTVTINNTEYAIRNKADYRVVLDVIASFEDSELTEEERVLVALIIFYEQIDTIEQLTQEFSDVDSLDEAVRQMMFFISCNDTDVGYNTKHKVVDWIQDEQLIVSAVNNVAQTEIRALPYLHWWTFIGYYMAIGDSPLATVVSIRNKVARGKKLDDVERDFKRENPQYFRWKSEEEQSRQLIDELWNQDKK